MSTGRNTARDLVEEAKKRIVLLLVCLFGLSYLMSLTSSSVWVNLPAAASLIIFLRYISLDIDVRRRATACNKLSLVDQSSKKRFVEPPKISLDKSNWKRKVNSPEVEAAIDQFTRHLISEWVTDLWYSRITSDTDGPEELVQIMNDVLGEVSSRAREINLIDLLTRDLINLVCNHLELYRSSQSKIGKEELRSLPIDRHDMQFRLVLAAENKLHPALFSIEAEHKVLQHLMDGLISFTFKPKDLQCSFFRYTARELLSCAVMRPILNLANPRVINEKIESLVLSLTNKADKGVAPSAEAAPLIKPNGPSRISADQFPGSLDRSTVGVELVQFKHQRSATASDRQMLRNGSGTFLQEDLKNSGPNSVGIYNASMLPMRDKPLPPRLDLISGDAQLSYPSSSLPSDSRKVDENKSGACNSGGEWGQVLDKISKRKTQALAPEHFENMWTKGRNYRKKEGANQVTKQVVHNTSVGISDPSCHLEVPSNHSVKDRTLCVNISGKNNASSQHEDVYVAENLHAHTDGNSSTHPPITSYQEKIEQLNREMVEPDSESSYPTEDDENNNVTGLNSPGTRVWDSKNKRNAALSHIRHPLESSELLLAKKSGQGHVRHPRTSRTQSGRKRSRPSNNKIPTWQEVERTSFLLGDGQDILNASKRDANAEESSDDPEMESWGRIHSGAATSSSASSISVSESCYSSLKSPENSLLADSFLKLRPEVLGANIVKSGSGTFAVYSIAVNDVNNNSWSIKRRFRHFEELHRRLKEFPEYNLSLPPKHFLSSGLDVPVIQERCKLLDKYLKKLLELPTISGSIEVWDFLSVDSQTYMFSDSLSIIQTLSVDLDDKTYEKSAKIHSSVEDISGQLFSWGEYLTSAGKDYAVQMNKNYFESDSSRLSKRSTEHNLETNVKKESKNYYQDNSGSDSDIRVRKNASSSTKSDKPLKVPLSGADGLQETPRFPETAGDSTIPSEWVPPNLSVPILDLVDVIFQLQDGGWIRRKAFWIAKQLLQLGMGDAFDDWLIEKIQFLRRGSVIASGIKRVEQILWPDGIFITKHPKRKTPTPVPSPKNGAAWKDNKENSMLTSEQQLEAARRAKFVHELIIDKAPAALVSLVGRKEYERCAQDIYFFLQSPVCLKQLAFELLELLLLAAFPELDDVVRKCHEEKEQFGKFEDKR